MTREIYKKIKSIVLTENDTIVQIVFDDDTHIQQYHEQDCCESVWVSQVDSNPDRFINAEAYSITEKVSHCVEGSDDSCTATFYTLATSKGYLDWHWQGESNGYYSESVECKFVGNFPEL